MVCDYCCWNKCKLISREFITREMIVLQRDNFFNVRIFFLNFIRSKSEELLRFTQFC